MKSIKCISLSHVISSLVPERSNRRRVITVIIQDDRDEKCEVKEARQRGFMMKSVKKKNFSSL